MHRQGAEVGRLSLFEFRQAGAHIGFREALIALNRDLAQREADDLQLDHTAQVLRRQRHAVQLIARQLERVFQLASGLLQGDQAALANKAIEHSIDLCRRERHIATDFKATNRKARGGPGGLRYSHWRGRGSSLLRQHRQSTSQQSQKRGLSQQMPDPFNRMTGLGQEASRLFHGGKIRVVAVDGRS